VVPDQASAVNAGEVLDRGIAALLGDYSATTTPETLMKQKYGGSNVEYQLAELAHVRFLSVAETKRGAELEEATVKHITGGDTINARSPYGRPFSYRPQFTIWMSTNHKPEIPDGSEAIWDRLRLIPFTQRFDGKKADTALPVKLREELPGVLAWAVRGCVAWVEHGLGSAQAVDRATAEYRAETDLLEEFFQDRCYFYPEGRVSKKDLYQAWEAWCDAMGVSAGAMRTFSSTVKERGVVKNFRDGKVDKDTRGWQGIALSPPPSNNPNVSGKNPCKHMGGESSQRHSDIDFEKPLRNTPTYEGFPKNHEDVSPMSPGSSPPPSEDDYLDGPATFEANDLTIEYMPEGRE
jgi:P4 family phage/plasmid primase-like protien